MGFMVLLLILGLGVLIGSAMEAGMNGQEQDRTAIREHKLANGRTVRFVYGREVPSGSVRLRYQEVEQEVEQEKPTSSMFLDIDHHVEPHREKED